MDREALCDQDLEAVLSDDASGDERFETSFEWPYRGGKTVGRENDTVSWVGGGVVDGVRSGFGQFL
jgi:hypothetical protein